MPSVRRPAIGDMQKTVYDPDEDGLIALAQLVSAVCSETEVLPIIETAFLHVVATGVAGYLEVLKAVFATVADFQTNPATGDFTFPFNLNDNNTANRTYPSAVGKYCVVDFGKLVGISRFRHHGGADNTNMNGRFKLEYMDMWDNWHDWVIDIIPVVGASWSEFDSSGGVVACKQVKLTCTTYDFDSKVFEEMEVIY